MKNTTRYILLSLICLLLPLTALAEPPLPQEGQVSQAAIEQARIIDLATPPPEGHGWENREMMENDPYLLMGYGDRDEGIDNDTAHVARGSTIVIHIFINHGSHAWTTAEMEIAAAKAAVAKEFYEDEAPWNAELEFYYDTAGSYLYYNPSITATIPEDGMTWTHANDALADAGFSDNDSDGTRIDDMTHFLQHAMSGYYDNVLAVF